MFEVLNMSMLTFDTMSKRAQVCPHTPFPTAPPQHAHTPLHLPEDAAGTSALQQSAVAAVDDASAKCRLCPNAGRRGWGDEPWMPVEDLEGQRNGWECGTNCPGSKGRGAHVSALLRGWTRFLETLRWQPGHLLPLHFAFLSVAYLCLSCVPAQRAFAIEFCTSSLRTEMESKHCLVGNHPSIPPSHVCSRSQSARLHASAYLSWMTFLPLSEAGSSVPRGGFTRRRHSVLTAPHLSP